MEGDLSVEERFDALVRLIEILRGEDGCPWDREQTKESLSSFLIEEAYEVIEAIRQGSADRLKEEVGDLLFQLLFLCQICKEEGDFSLDELLKGVMEKMMRRHPHVFGVEKLSSARDVWRKWESIKREEGGTEQSISLLNNLPAELPALLKAYMISTRVARVGFDWEKGADILSKLEEEVKEFKEACLGGAPDKVEQEMGDILFVLVNIARHLGVNPEIALQRTNRKFIERFKYIEEKLQAKGKEIDEATLEEMEELWQEAKGI